MKSRIVSLGLVLATMVFARQVSATVTVQGWWHFDDAPGTTPNVLLDSSGNGRNYQQGAIVDAHGFAALAGALVSSEAVGGPLDTNGYTSTHSLRLGLEADSDTFWETGYVPPASNYCVEIWIKPQNKGGFWYDGNNPYIFSSGGFNCCSGPWGGACVRVEDLGFQQVIVAGIIVGENSSAVFDFGPQIPIDTNNWMHLALVNTNGVVSFYTNGVLCAVNTAGNETAPAGVMHLGTDGAWDGFDGYIDEERVFTFDSASEFSPSDLLYAQSPRITQQPQDIAVWENGAATLQVDDSTDPCTTYQWYLGGTNAVGGATADLYLNPVASGNDGDWYNCKVTNACSGMGVTSSNAALSVVPVNSANVSAYRDLVNAESSLVAFYTVDGNTGTTLTDTKGGHNGTLEGGASYDGQTNRAFGSRALFFKHGDGDVQIPANAAFNFASGDGTIEALIYLMSPPTPEPGTYATIFSQASTDGSTVGYQIGVAVDGGTLIYTNDTGVKLTWAVPVSVLNRFAHVAFVFSGGTDVTAYVDGESLGTLTQTGFGTTGTPCWIGTGPLLGAVITNNVPGNWYGAIDELAVYSSALASTNLEIHNSKFLYGTNTVAPSIVSQPQSKTLYAGGSPALTVTVAGTPPLSYQWTSNGVPISGATSSTLKLANTTTDFSATYSLSVENIYGTADTTPFTLTFVNPPAGYASAVMSDHPLAYWSLADASGPTAIDSAGVNDGTYTNSGVTYGVAGPPGDPSSGAVSFDGVAGRVIVPYARSLNPSGPFSVEFWAKPAAYGFYSPVSSQVRPAFTGGYEFYMAGNYGGYEFHTASGGSYNMAAGDDSAPPSGVWAHVAGVWDGSTLMLYINGYPATTDTNNAPPFVPNASTPFYIGSRSDGAAYFNGAMSDVAFYNYALSQSQIQTHLNMGQQVQLAISKSANVIADTTPSGEAHDAMNVGATWMASDNGRSGVMSFTATNSNQIMLYGYQDLALTNGTIMFWMRSAGVVSYPGYAGGEAALLFDWRPGGQAAGTYAGIVIGQQDDCSWCNHGSIMVQGGNGKPSANSGGVSVSDNNWHHVAITYDTDGAASTSVTLYIDGTAVTTGYAGDNWSWPGQDTVIQLGADTRYDGWWNHYNGEMDEVRIYNRILSAGEIGTAKNGGLLTSDLVLRYSFDTPPGGYEVTWPYGNLLAAPSPTGPWAWPGGLTNTPPFPAISPFPVSDSTVEKMGMQFFGGAP